MNGKIDIGNLNLGVMDGVRFGVGLILGKLFVIAFILILMMLFFNGFLIMSIIFGG